MSEGNINKIKAAIYSQIELLNDETTLLMLQEAVTEYSSTNDILNQLTPEQQHRLQESIKQAEEGKTISSEEVRKKVNEWLSR